MPIIKHNKLIETSYKLNSREQFFVLYLISKISQNDREFREHRMHYSEIERIINFDGKRRIANKSEVFALMDKLNSEPIVYEQGSIIGRSVWLQHMEHDTETDEFTFSLSEKLREYLIQLKEHFTRYNISNIVYLNANAVRLYEVLKRYQFRGECELTVEKIKFFLGIEDCYPKFYEFKRWVLLPSQKEIEKYTDIRFEFVPAKKERKRILSLKFYIYENEPSFQPDTTMHMLSSVEKGAAGPSRPSKPTPVDDDWSIAQQRAYEFLAERGVNKTFIREQVMTHPKLKYQPLQGAEDLYIQRLWHFFLSKTNADKPAGAFVSWWKKGKLTEDGLHARILESVIQYRKQRLADEITEQESRVGERAIGSNLFSFNRSTFNIDQFKNDYPEQYQRILQEVRNEYELTFQNLQQEFDPDKYRKAIQDKVLHTAREWFRNMSSKQH